MANLEDQFKLSEFMSKPRTEGGMSYGDYPNPYGLRAFPTPQGYGGEMMPKTTGWAGEVPTLTGDKMTELSLGGEKGQLFHPMLYKGITPDEIEIVRDYEAGLRDDNDPLVKAVKAKAEAEARKLAHMHQSPFKDLEPKMADGGKATSFVDESSPLSVALDEWLKGDAPLARIMRGEGDKIVEDLKKPAKPMTEQEMMDVALNFGPMAIGSIEGNVAKALGKRAAKYTKKEAIKGDLRDMPFEEALPLAQKGVHLKQDPSGQFVGAPRGVKSMRDINKLRSEYDKMVEEGALGGDWYERAQQFHKEYTPNPEASRELSRANALFSAQADPISNLGFTLQAHNALEAGAKQPIVRTGPQASRYYKAAEEGKDIPLGQKTDIYAKYIDPEQGIGSTGVNDFRHARNFGYTQLDKETGKAVPITRGLSPQEHAFLDAETILATNRANAKKLAGKESWNPEEIQAAPWVLQKAQSLMKSSPGRFPTIEDAFAEANKTYLEGAPKYTAFNTYEQIPFATSGHLADIEKLPLNLKEEYSKAANWVDQFGKDILSPKVGGRHGLLTGKTQEGLGSYTNPVTNITEFNPQSQSRSLVGMAPGKEGPVVQPQSAALMDAMSALRGYFDVQGASPWIKPVPGAVTPSTSLHLKLNKPLSENEMQSLTKTANDHGFTGVIDLGKDGVMLAFNDAVKSGQDLAKMLKEGFRDKLHEAVPDKIGSMQRVRTEGGYKGFEDVWAKAHEGSGKATQQLFDYLKEAEKNAPDVVKRLLDADPVIAKQLEKMNKRDIEAASKYGIGEPRKDVLNAREIVSKEGLSGLEKALKSKQYLPAAFALPLAPKKREE